VSADTNEELEVLFAQYEGPFPDLVESEELDAVHWKELGSLKGDLVLAQMIVHSRLCNFAEGKEPTCPPFDSAPLRQKFDTLPEDLLTDPQLQKAVPDLIDWLERVEDFLRRA
jgi:hypothetical protein